MQRLINIISLARSLYWLESTRVGMAWLFVYGLIGCSAYGASMAAVFWPLHLFAAAIVIAFWWLQYAIAAMIIAAALMLFGFASMVVIEMMKAATVKPEPVNWSGRNVN